MKKKSPLAYCKTKLIVNASTTQQHYDSKRDNKGMIHIRIST
jgi:hypothetical protein